MKKTFAVSLSALLFLTLVGTTLAADHSNLILTDRGVMVTHPSKVITPAATPDPDLKTIAGTLSDYQYAVFFCCYGFYITGLKNDLGVVPEYWQAVPFTPSANMTVKEVEASVMWDEGVNEVILSVNNDSNGLPGTAIEKFVAKNLATLGTCCQLAVGKSKAGIPVNQGTQYWLVVSTNSKDENIFAAWEVNTTDMRSHPFASYCDDQFQGTCNGTSGTWQAVEGLLPGFAVLGK